MVDLNNILTKAFCGTSFVGEVSLNCKEDTHLSKFIFSGVKKTLFQKHSIQFVLQNDTIDIYCVPCGRILDNLSLTICNRLDVIAHFKDEKHLNNTSGSTIKSNEIHWHSAQRNEILCHIFRDSYSLFMSNASYIGFKANSKRMKVFCLVCASLNKTVVSRLNEHERRKLFTHLQDSSHSEESIQNDCKTGEIDLNEMSVNLLKEYKLTKLLKCIPQHLKFNSKYIRIKEGKVYCTLCYCFLSFKLSEEIEGAVFLHVTGFKHRRYINLIKLIKRGNVNSVNMPDKDLENYFETSDEFKEHRCFIESFLVEEEDCLLFCKLCKCFFIKGNITEMLPKHLDGRKHLKMSQNQSGSNSIDICTEEIVFTKRTTQFENKNANKNFKNEHRKEKNVLIPIYLNDLSLGITYARDRKSEIRILKEDKDVSVFYCCICLRNLHCFDKINLASHLMSKKHMKKVKKPDKRWCGTVKLNQDGIIDDVIGCIVVDLKYSLTFKKWREIIIIRGESLCCNVCKVKIFSIISFKLDKFDSINKMIIHLEGRMHTANIERKFTSKQEAKTTVVDNIFVDYMSDIEKLNDITTKEFFFTENIPFSLYYNQPYIMVTKNKFFKCYVCCKTVKISNECDYLFKHLISPYHIECVEKQNIFDIIKCMQNKFLKRNVRRKYNRKCFDNLIYHLQINKKYIRRNDHTCSMYFCSSCKVYHQEIGNLSYHRLFQGECLLLNKQFELYIEEAHFPSVTYKETELDKLIKNINYNRKKIRITNKGGELTYNCSSHFKSNCLALFVEHLSSKSHSPKADCVNLQKLVYQDIHTAFGTKIVTNDYDRTNPNHKSNRLFHFDVRNLNGTIASNIYDGYLIAKKESKEHNYIWCTVCNCEIVNPSTRFMIGHLTSFIHINNIEHLERIIKISGN